MFTAMECFAILYKPVWQIYFLGDIGSELFVCNLQPVLHFKPSHIHGNILSLTHFSELSAPPYASLFMFSSATSSSSISIVFTLQ